MVNNNYNNNNNNDSNKNNNNNNNIYNNNSNNNNNNNYNHVVSYVVLTDRQMDGRTYGWMDEPMNRWMNQSTNTVTCKVACTRLKEW